MTARIAAAVDAARATLHRLGPDEAAAAQRDGALLVDTRPVQDRRRYGTIPEALTVERNVLEWRLDPTSPDRLPQVRDTDQVIIVICNEGYASSLAAASLQSLGLRHATDLVGGFHAWADAGLPVSREVAEPEPATRHLPPRPGTAPPDVLRNGLRVEWARRFRRRRRRA